jgi:hypothetical protein
MPWEKNKEQAEPTNRSVEDRSEGIPKKQMEEKIQETEKSELIFVGLRSNLVHKQSDDVAGVSKGSSNKR